MSRAVDNLAIAVIKLGRQDPELGRTRAQELDTVLVLHGPSSNLFGERDPSYYGTESLDDIEKYATAAGQKLGLRVVCAQDNYEGAMVEHIHAARTYGAVIMNPNSFVHYSYAIKDAIESVFTPVIEVHLSNLYKRAFAEPYRSQNVTAAASQGYICGCGIQGYDLAMQRAKYLISERKKNEKGSSIKINGSGADHLAA